MARFNFSKGKTECDINIDLKTFIENHFPSYTKETLHVDKAIQIIDESFSKYKSLNEIAIKIKRGEKTVQRIIKNAFGIKHKQLVEAFRIYCALYLLYKTKLDITYVAINLSYSDLSSMDRDFHKVLGITPIEATEQLIIMNPDKLFKRYHRF